MLAEERVIPSLEEWGMSFEEIEGIAPTPKVQKPTVQTKAAPQPKVDWLAIAQGFKPVEWAKKNEKTLFFLVAAPLVVGSLAYFAIRSQPSPQEDQGMIDPSQGKLTLEQAIAITQTGVVPGNQAASIEQVLQATRMVMAWQEDELIQYKTNQIQLAIQSGIGTPGHPCFQFAPQQCLSKLQTDALAERQDALNRGDTNTVILVDQILRAQDRIREGTTDVAKYMPQLQLMARTKYTQAIEMQQAVSPEGQAQLFNQAQQPMQAGMQYNPATGQLEPIPQQP